MEYQMLIMTSIMINIMISIMINIMAIIKRKVYSWSFSIDKRCPGIYAQVAGYQGLLNCGIPSFCCRQIAIMGVLL